MYFHINLHIEGQSLISFSAGVLENISWSIMFNIIGGIVIIVMLLGGNNFDQM